VDRGRVDALFLQLLDQTISASLGPTEDNRLVVGVTNRRRDLDSVHLMDVQEVVHHQ